MTTTSYPAVGDNGLTDAQWNTMYGQRDGIIEDYIGNAGQLTRINSGDICRISPVKVSVNGYTLDISTNPVDLVCAPVVSGTKTYRIAAVYDPALNIAQGSGDPTPGGRSALGPCRLIITDAALDMTGGKSYVILYEIDRSASQLLTNTTVRDLRRWVGPVISMPDYPTAGVAIGGFGPFARGALLIQTDTDGILESSTISVRNVNDAGTSLVWQNLTSPPPVAFPAPSPLVAYDSPAEYYRYAGQMIGCRGTLQRASGSPLSTGGSGADVILGTMPAGAKPHFVQRFVCLAGGTSSLFPALLKVDGAGVVTMYASSSTIRWIDLSSIKYRAGG